MCVPDVKKLNVKVFSLMSRTNGTRHIKWHETCKCKLDLIRVFGTINNLGLMIIVGVNAKN